MFVKLDSFSDEFLDNVGALRILIEKSKSELKNNTFIRIPRGCVFVYEYIDSNGILNSEEISHSFSEHSSVYNNWYLRLFKKNNSIFAEKNINQDLTIEIDENVTNFYILNEDNELMCFIPLEIGDQFFAFNEYNYGYGKDFVPRVKKELL